MYKTQCVLAWVALYVGLAHSWDIAISTDNQLRFYTNATKTGTVRLNNQNLMALTYDEVHDTLLYVDKHKNNDNICGFTISTNNNNCIIERSGRNIHGIAFDPANELLFFSDVNEKSIYWFSLKSGAKNNLNGNLLIKMDDGVPTDIAVDSCRGYIYWMNTNRTTPRIERARFNGSERELVINLTSVFINTTYTMEPHSLAIDQQTEKMFFVEPARLLRYTTYIADLNGKNKFASSHFDFQPHDKILTNPLNVLTVSNTSLISSMWYKNPVLWQEAKTGKSIKQLFTVETKMPIGIVANYKISDQVRGITNCDALTNLVQNISGSNNSLKIAKEYEGPFCVNGTKINGQSRCICTPGYIGERCDVSVCTNYCSNGTCSISDDGFPTCSCNAGYSGERCDFNSCHDYCLNNGECSLNEESEPVCYCKGGYVGDRCEVSPCLNYCFQGNCSFNEDGLPTCSCKAGYSGQRCEVDACHSYCLNDGECSLDEEDEPVCQCGGHHEGPRCEAVKAASFTTHNITQFTNDSAYDSTTKNLTLVDLLTNWRKRSAKIIVSVEV